METPAKKIEPNNESFEKLRKGATEKLKHYRKCLFDKSKKNFLKKRSFGHFLASSSSFSQDEDELSHLPDKTDQKAILKKNSFDFNPVIKSSSSRNNFDFKILKFFKEDESNQKDSKTSICDENHDKKNKADKIMICEFDEKSRRMNSSKMANNLKLEQTKYAVASNKKQKVKKKPIKYNKLKMTNFSNNTFSGKINARNPSNVSYQKNNFFDLNNRIFYVASVKDFSCFHENNSGK